MTEAIYKRKAFDRGLTYSIKGLAHDQYGGMMATGKQAGRHGVGTAVESIHPGR